MTRKDYIKLAGALYESRLVDLSPKKGSLAKDKAFRDAHRSACFAVADTLATDNPRFDRARFLEACGLRI